MSIWNTLEDIEKRKEAYTWISPFSSYTYEDEKERVRRKQESLIKAEADRKQQEESYKFLVQERDSLYHRINLADAISNSIRSSNIKLLTAAIRNEMLDLSVEIAENINKTGWSLKCELLTEDEKTHAKKTLILQVMNRIRRAVNNTTFVSEDEIAVILGDIKSLASWYKIDSVFISKSFAEQHGDSTNAMDFFKTETGYDSIVCPRCGRITTSFFDKCLYCGKKTTD